MPGLFESADEAPTILEMPLHTIRTKGEPFKKNLYDEVLTVIILQTSRKRYRKTFMTESAASAYANLKNGIDGTTDIAAVPIRAWPNNGYDVIVDEVTQTYSETTI